MVGNLTAELAGSILGGVAGGGVVALLVALGVVFFVLMAILYVYCAIALMTIANKTKTQNAWMAWIPVINFYLITQIAGVSGLWTLALLVLLVPVSGLSILLWVVSIWLFWRIAKRRKFPGWLSLFLIIPVVNLVVLGILAWGKK